MTNRYIIKLPFKGTSQSFTYINADNLEVVAYSGYLYNDNKGDMTLGEYLAYHNRLHHPNDKLIVIGEDELNTMIIKYNNSLKTKPKRITKKQYWDWLECLPPCRWHSVAGATVFHISERLTGNLVQWCVNLGDKYYGFTDNADITDIQLAAHIATIK